MLTTPDFTEITPQAQMRTATHGNRAKCLQRLLRLDLPVPLTVALPFTAVRAIAEGPVAEAFTQKNLAATYGGKLGAAHLAELSLGARPLPAHAAG